MCDVEEHEGKSNDAKCSLNDAKYSINDGKCSLNEAKCSLNDAKRSLNDKSGHETTYENRKVSRMT
jgi:uncharacterized low-complexity protein